VADAREWLAGTRPRTLPAAVVPVLIGSGVALGYGRFSWWRALLALAVALALQVGVNFANDYSDGVRTSGGSGRSGWSPPGWHRRGRYWPRRSAASSWPGRRAWRWPP
jgi:hypothetical protein